MGNPNLFKLRVSVTTPGTDYETHRVFVTQAQFNNFKYNIDIADGEKQNRMVFLEHSGGTTAYSRDSILSFELLRFEAEKELEQMIVHYPNLSLEIAMRETCLQHIRPFVQDLRYESKLLEERVKEHIGRNSFPPHDPKIPTVDERRALNAEEFHKKCSMEKYDPKDDRALTKPHCCVHEHGLMREATEQERWNAIKKASAF